MLVEWLREAMQEGRPAGRYLVLLYLVRGRLPEALKAFRELRSTQPEAKTGALFLLSGTGSVAVYCLSMRQGTAAKP